MRHGTTDSRLEINLTPLLDLVLQLIMFFMLTVNFVRVDQVGELVELPVAQSAMSLAPAGDELVYVNINQNGEKLAEGRILRTALELRRYIEVRKDRFDRMVRTQGITIPANLRIVIRAHKEASWGDVWDTLEECNRAGYRSWQLRVIKKAG
jgi:biopolymer transport protein ExbD